MNYKKHYDLLIERSRTRVLTGYVEKHHIVPKCLGGSDDTENIAVLTPEEHFLAHQLLVKIYPNSPPLVNAALMMTTHHTSARANNKLFGWLRRRFSTNRKEWYLNNEHPKGMLGKHHKLENIDKITAGIKQVAIEKRIPIYAYELSGLFYKQYSSISECSKDLGTNASNVKYTADGKFGFCKGKQLKYDYFESISPYIRPKCNTYTRSNNHKENQSSRAKTNTAICKYCGMESIKANITRWHNDKCKHKL